MKKNKYMNEILDILYNQTNSFNINLKYNKEDIPATDELKMQQLYRIPYLGRKGSDFNRENCKEIVNKINKVIEQYKHDMWEEDKKQGIKYNEMTNYFVEPINEEFAQIMEKFLGQELKDMNTKGNA
jgi:hypothetical protein